MSLVAVACFLPGRAKDLAAPWSIMHWLSPFCYMAAKFGPLGGKKKDKKVTSNEITFFRRTAGHTLLDYKTNEEVLGRLKVESVDEKLRTYKSN